ncbi:GNAT family N-acetyltransferase [Actinacidiphila acididurans]|uniref:GNAT family N-acetyltransferase n=1 Tax=Actinacidiphila acididurans TaxID=2784346 RepID=UPI0027DB70E6|nr:GNAT family N-acetyltransferase [Actinacidiphila acididurans]
MTPLILRPVRDDEADAELVREVAAAASGTYRALPGPDDGHGHRAGGHRWPGDGWTEERSARHRGRTRHLARTDPGGCWVVEDRAAGPIAVALSARREGTWSLSLLAVVPQARGKGVGAALLNRTMEHGRACLRALACAPADPVAVRTLRRAGFDVHPAMRLTGLADPARLDPPDGAVHEGTARHRDLMDSVDRRTRGGAHGPDHEELLRHHRLFVVDDLAGSGYCYAGGGRVEALAATSRRLATRLLTAALLATPPGDPVDVPHVLAEGQWALDVAVAAGLHIVNDGFVCLRGMRPPELALTSTLFP